MNAGDTDCSLEALIEAPDAQFSFLATPAKAFA